MPQLRLSIAKEIKKKKKKNSDFSTGNASESWKPSYRYVLLACPTPAQAGLTNSLTQSPFITGHEMDGEKTAGINQWLHPYAPSLETSHPGEAEKTI